MNLRIRTISSLKFWIYATIYICISFVAFLFSSGGYSAVIIFIFLGSFYLGGWSALTLVCIFAKRIQYSMTLIYSILSLQMLALLLNVEDSGYYGVTKCSKNFAQRFLE
jgi:hypothetical protein